MTPMKTVPAEQVWFWSEEWQKGMKEAKEDFDEGRFTNYESVEDLIADLEKEIEYGVPRL